MIVGDHQLDMPAVSLQSFARGKQWQVIGVEEPFESDA
jgi:hypothetical protein